MRSKVFAILAVPRGRPFLILNELNFIDLFCILGAGCNRMQNKSCNNSEISFIFIIVLK
jgi:hypothetical protein